MNWYGTHFVPYFGSWKNESDSSLPSFTVVWLDLLTVSYKTESAVMSTDQWQQICVVARTHSSQWLALLRPRPASGKKCTKNTNKNGSPGQNDKKEKEKQNTEKSGKGTLNG